MLLLALSIHADARGGTGMRKVDFKNRVFPFTARTFLDLPRRVRVRKGLYHSSHREPGVSYSYFKVAEVVYGDLNGDGSDEAAVVAIYGGAASDLYRTSIYIYTMNGRRLKLLAILNQEFVAKEYERYSHDGRSYLFESVAGGTRIERGHLTVRHFAGGSHCCPPDVFTLRLKFKRGVPLVAGESLRRRTEAEERIPHSGDDR
jgi:hypothetical protein